MSFVVSLIAILIPCMGLFFILNKMLSDYQEVLLERIKFNEEEVKILYGVIRKLRCD